MKVVINKRCGGYSLSKEGVEFLGLEWDGYGYCPKVDRHDPKLVECVETLGDKANGKLARLVVIEIPDDVNYTIGNYDGVETVEEVHRSWG